LDEPICWHYKSQKRVTLSSTEAEYVAISKAVKEVKVVYHLLCDLYVESSNHGKDGQHWSNIYVGDFFDQLLYLAHGHMLSLCPRIH
jgi:hypothetical protein